MSELARSKKAITIETLTKKYGEEEGKRKFKEYCDKQAYSNSFEYKFAKHGWTFQKFDAFNKSRAITIETLTKKYGEEEGKRKFKEYCDKQAINGCSLRYFIEKYGGEEGTKKYELINSQKSITLKNMQRVHGAELGKEKIQNWLKRTNFSSNMANHFISEVIKNLLNYDNTLTNSILYWAHGEKGEFHVFENRSYLYDLVITGNYRICIEFNGTYWHADPRIYEAIDIVKLPGQHVSAEIIWEKDRKKRSAIESQNFAYLAVWEIDYMEDPSTLIEETTQWILSNRKL